MLKFNLKPQPKKNRRFKKSEKGMALIESIPILFLMAVILNFSLGFFGAIHSGILNSIASYNYSLETFRYRSNLMYFRPGGDVNNNYKLTNNRVHGTIKEGSEVDDYNEDQKWATTVRSITFNNSLSGSKFCDTEDCRQYEDNPDPGSKNLWKTNSQYTPDSNNSVLTPRIWVKTVYGICLNADCGG